MDTCLWLKQTKNIKICAKFIFTVYVSLNTVVKAPQLNIELKIDVDAAAAAVAAAAAAAATAASNKLIEIMTNIKLC